MKEHSWLCTFITQISLCFCVYLAFNMGDRTESSSRPVETYFMSVAGGFRPENEQTLLLKLMEKVAKVYKVQFVVSISELGENDPLGLNATWYFQSLKLPWYTTKSFKGQRPGSYLKHTKVQYGKTLDIVIVNTELFQGPSAGAIEHQLLWLMKTLEESTSDWRIVVGFHPLLACNGSTEAKDNPLCLHEMFLNHRVDAYLSGHACTEHVHKQSAKQPGNADQPGKGPCLTPIRRIFDQNKEKVNGLLLHRVSSLELVTYSINLEGDVAHKIELQQSGREAM
ncbi:unnamed protein product [Coffea canephora]|uniref:Uncharacterized protein n=2 Tax=Coffea TaxID=13442 RepID=A0A068UP81_COFCA|nr:uncharacterized protein LOC113691493 isoform X1 [Coffea arabica]CDP10206.1 unnamed protein product [Coffea canephora]